MVQGYFIVFVFLEIFSGLTVIRSRLPDNTLRDINWTLALAARGARISAAPDPQR